MALYHLKHGTVSLFHFNSSGLKTLVQIFEQKYVPSAIHILFINVPPVEITNRIAWQCGVGTAKGLFKKPMKLNSAQYTGYKFAAIKCKTIQPK